MILIFIFLTFVNKLKLHIFILQIKLSIFSAFISNLFEFTRLKIWMACWNFKRGTFHTRATLFYALIWSKMKRRTFIKISGNSEEVCIKFKHMPRVRLLFVWFFAVHSHHEASLQRQIFAIIILKSLIAKFLS